MGENGLKWWIKGRDTNPIHLEGGYYGFPWILMIIPPIGVDAVYHICSVRYQSVEFHRC